ncbi:hypothetical protein LTR01_009065 [Friedmanniomyces endolithicus]|nr:hypothetical protein LTR01_009065 [Friedmanniomyces endolithicus]
MHTLGTSSPLVFVLISLIRHIHAFYFDCVLFHMDTIELVNNKRDSAKTGHEAAASQLPATSSPEPEMMQKTFQGAAATPNGRT